MVSWLSLVAGTLLVLSIFLSLVSSDRGVEWAFSGKGKTHRGTFFLKIFWVLLSRACPWVFFLNWDVKVKEIDKRRSIG